MKKGTEKEEEWKNREEEGELKEIWDEQGKNTRGVDNQERLY